MVDLARVGALHGDRAKALNWLRQAVDGGYSKHDAMARDVDLQVLHGAEFDSLLAQAHQNAAVSGN
jgi:hypothetical protein